MTGIEFVDDLLSDDSILPDNVEGGIGLVTIRSVSRAVFDFGERELDGGDVHEWPME